MNSNKLLFILVFILLINSVYAFELIPSKSTIDPLCPRSTGLFTDVIISDKDSFYTVNVEGDGAKWSTAVPSGFILKAGEEKTIYTYVTPNIDVSSGNYFVNTVVSTEDGTKKVSHGFTIKNCYLSDLSFKQNSRTACPGDKGILYELLLRNSGEYRENYELSAKGDGITLSNNVVALNPDESKIIYAYVDAGEHDEGVNQFNFVAKTSNGNVIEAGGAVLNINPCYDFDVIADRNTFSICDGEKDSAQLTITNLGSTDNMYSLVLEAPIWVNVDKNSIELMKGSNGAVNLEMSPDYGVEGNFNVVIKTIPKYGYEVIEDSYNVDVKKCNNVDVDIVRIDETMCRDEELSYDAVVYNNGMVAKDYDLSLNAPDWVSLSDDSVNLNAGEKKTVLLNVDNASVGSYSVGLKADAADGSVSSEDKFILNVKSLEECYNAELSMSEREIVYYDDTVSIPVTVKNLGSRTASYELSLSGEGVNFVQLNPSSLSVESDKAEVVSLYIAPSAQVLGEYKIDVNVVADGTTILDSKTLSLKITNNKDEATVKEDFLVRMFKKTVSYFKGLIDRIRNKNVETPEQLPLEELINESIVENIPEVIEEVPEVVENVSVEPNLTTEEIPEVIDLEEAESLQFMTIANKIMGVGDKVIFKIDNIEHNVELTDLNSNGVTLRFSSDPFDVELALGEAKIVDLDGDGVFDIKVTFNDIKDGRADLTYEKLPKSQLSLIYNKIKENKVYVIAGAVLLILIILFIAFKIPRKIVNFFEEDFDEDGIKEIKEEVKEKKKSRK